MRRMAPWWWSSQRSSWRQQRRQQVGDDGAACVNGHVKKIQCKAPGKSPGVWVTLTAVGPLTSAAIHTLNAKFRSYTTHQLTRFKAKLCLSGLRSNTHMCRNMLRLLATHYMNMGSRLRRGSQHPPAHS
jgi:hypothetical protein